MFCPANCKHLSITEEQQDLYAKKPPHFCLKVRMPVVHRHYHPKLIQIEECKREILFRKFSQTK